MFCSRLITLIDRWLTFLEWTIFLKSCNLISPFSPTVRRKTFSNQRKFSAVISVRGLKNKTFELISTVIYVIYKVACAQYDDILKNMVYNILILISIKGSKQNKISWGVKTNLIFGVLLYQINATGLQCHVRISNNRIGFIVNHVWFYRGSLYIVQ